MYTYYVYIMTNKRNHILYIGVTRNLEYRVWEHKNKAKPGFTSRYNVTNLVYYEEFAMLMDAIQREKQLKNWHRGWKFNLIRKCNPKMVDLAAEWYERDPETSSG
ncbi:MAG: GIY-YIG nuclease family protein [Candidatus Kerfeldbacteria bacterium]|nr:GIY-YIG nuclease family protein [Candidatus Kerfeldbacteria bacterium]